jgi:hypothetical protein
MTALAAFLRITLAAAWAGVVVDVVVETAAAPAAGITAFGVVRAEPGVTATIWAVAGLAASAVAGLALAFALTWNDHVERRVAADLDARFERLAAESAVLGARHEKLAARIAEQHRRMESLARERQAVEEELGRQRRRVARLRELSLRSLRRLDTLGIELADAIAMTEPERDVAVRVDAQVRTVGDGDRAAADDAGHDVDAVVRLPDVSTSESDR